jgi:hypothetical protein
MRRVLLVTSLLALMLPSTSKAQSNATDAALDGFVSDPSGAIIQGAKIIAINLATSQVRETSTDRNGYYRFPLLQVGEYQIVVSAGGFSDHQRTGIHLSVGTQARVDVAMALGGAAETVTVTGDASMVAAGQASGAVLGREAVSTLPITSRNVYNFHLIGPGVKGLPSTGFGTTQFLVGGHNRMAWAMDGLDNSQRRTNRQIRLVISTPENVEEMQVLTGAYSAEFGRAAGGVINVISRSGTNVLHGSGMALVRPNAWSAKPPLATTKPQQEWWMVQGNVGGPLLKDRAFYFANYEFNPLKSPQPVTINRDAAAAIGIPASDLGNSPFGEEFHTPSVKVTYRAGDRNSGFFRVNRFTNDQPGAGGGLTTPSRSVSFKDRMWGVGAQLATTFGDGVLNELRSGLNRRSELRRPYGESTANGANVNITSVANFGVNPLMGSASVEASFQIIDNLTWTRGRHTLKSGFDYQTTSFDVTSALTRAFTFSGLAANATRPAVTPLQQYLNTVGGVVDPSTGRPYSYTQLQQEIGDATLTQRYHYINLFLQDEMRLRPDVTLSAGLRYELTMFPVLDAQAPYPLSREVNDDTNNFAPRIGVTWRPFGSERTALRGGYGLFYDTTSLGLVVNAAQINGRRILSYTVPGTDPRAPVYPNLLATGNPAFSTPPNITVFPEDFEIMFAHQASVSIERQLTDHTIASVGYSFWGHRNTPYSHDTNLGPATGVLADGRPTFPGAAQRPNQSFRAINLVESQGRGSYHGLDFTVRQRMTAGLQLSASYGFSRANSIGDMEGGALMDPTDPERDWGPSPGDLRHNVSGQASYSPELKSSSLRWLNGVQFSTLVFYNSGFPVNATAGIDLNNDLVLNDRALFRERNAFTGPDYLQVDFRLSRRFGLSGGSSVDLMIESENLLNRTNAACSIAGCTSAVVNREGAADFGRITATRPGRYIQLGGRFNF